MARVSKDLQALELEAAASILLYDIQEIESFKSLYSGTIEENQIEASGNFHLFLKFIDQAYEDKMFLDSESNQDKITEYIEKLGEHIPDGDTNFKFMSWFNEVKQEEIPLSLTTEIMDHYIWEDYKRKIQLIDQSDIPFGKKIDSRPKQIEMNDSKSNLLSLGDVDLSLDTKNNKKFSTGLEFVDDYIPLAGTNFMVVAARPGVGKSLFMLQQAIENSRGGMVVGTDKEKLRPKKSLFISLEMSAKSVHDRIFGYLVQENLKDLSVDGYEKKVNEIQQSDKFQNVMNNLKILVTDSNNGLSIISDIERAIDKEGIEAVFIDYLQLLKFPGTDEWGAIRQATNALKNLAFKKNVLVVTGSQVSRQSTERGLSLTDLFGGSTIEADADCIVGMEALRERRQGVPNAVNIKILKNREGELGDEQVEIDYSYGLITRKAEF